MPSDRRSNSKKSSRSSRSSNSRRSNNSRRPDRSRGKKLLNYQEFMSREMKNIRDEYPDLKNTEYMRMAAEEWQNYKYDNGIESGNRR